MGTYFTNERAMHRFFYIQGMTSDVFYTDSGMCVDLEWLLFQELSKCGYERIVYVDRDLRIYCYDDRTLNLLRDGKKAPVEEKKSSTTPKKKGLKMGKWAKNAQTQTEKEEKEEPKEQKDIGRLSGIQMVKMQGTPLNLGMSDDNIILNQVAAYMMDSSVKAAIIFADANDYLTRLSRAGERTYNLAKYLKLPPNNKNIMIFIYPKKNINSILEISQLDEERQEYIKNIINVCGPNALEIRNMLTYFRKYPKVLEEGEPVRLNIKAKHLLDTSMELKRYISQVEEEPMEIKEFYQKLVRFAQTGKELSPDNCYEIFDCKKLATGEELLNNMIGMQNVKDAITGFRGNVVDSEEKVKYLTSSRIVPDKDKPERAELMHVALMGNPGTGKTTVAKLLGQIYYEMGYLESGHVIEVDRSSLVAGYVGQTAIRTRERVMDAMGGVLFVDEAYALARSEQEGSNDFGPEAIDTLIKAMDEFKGKFIVVLAGYPKEMSYFLDKNPGMRSRVRLSLTIDDYTPEEMYQILVTFMKRENMRFSEELEAQMADFCENWVNLADENWGNGREAENLSADFKHGWQSDHSAKTEIIDGEEWKIIEAKHIPQSKQKYLKPVAQLRAEVMEQLNELPGLGNVKRQIESIRQSMIVGDKDEPGHYIFSGNPGTGKTTVARYMGQILRNHNLLKRGHLVEYTAGKLVKDIESSRNKGFLDFASKALDGVLFIDEAYQLLNTHTGRDIIEQLVPFMENNRDRLCVICAGYEEEMEAFVDANQGLSSRFKEVITFEDYSGEELQSILFHMLRQEQIEWDEEYAEKSLRALTRYMEKQGKKKGFGNARYIRTKYIPKSKEARNARLNKTYGEKIPEEEKRKLTGADIPAELVKYTREKLPKPDTRTASERIDSLIRFEEIKKELRKLLKSAKYRNEDGSGAKLVDERLHWILKGNPGTGKTTIAKLIGAVYKECGLLTKGHTKKVTKSDLVAEYTGQTAPKTRRAIEKAMDGILFIDEAYALVGDKFGEEAIAELVEAMSDRNGEFAVVAAGYPDKMDEFIAVNEGMSSRCKVFEIEDYTPEELYRIFLLKCKEAGMELEPKLDEKMQMFFVNYKARASKVRTWANGREVENLLRDMQSMWFDNQIVETDEEGYVHRILSEEHVPEEYVQYLKGKVAKKREEKTVLEQLQDMVGFAEVKENLENLLQLAKTSKEHDMPELMDELNLHWVLKGNPGTGKTTVAKMIGKVYKEIGVLKKGHCVKVTRDDLVAEYVGQTAIKTKKKIKEAMGGVLFIDEAYALKRANGQSNHDFGQEAIDTILEAMSNYNGEFAVIAAGYPKEMDVFLKSNPGFISRFNEQIFNLEDYNANELAQIFVSICDKREFKVDDELQEAIVQLFERLLLTKSSEWANGREAENLERKMRNMWAKTPVILDTEDGGRERVYTLQHLPEIYANILGGTSNSAAETKKANEKEKQVKIPYAALPGVWENFDHAKDLEKQGHGVVLIRCETAHGSRTGKGYGTGFMLTSDGYIITCRHVIEHATKIDVRLCIPGRAAGEISWHSARCEKISQKHDMALLKIDVMSYPTLPVRMPDKETKVGEEIYLLGYPFGDALSDDVNELHYTLFQGYVGSIQMKQGCERINTDMEAKRGCSGGPVFSKEDGAIIGILCGSQIEGDQRLMEEINYVLPMKYILMEVMDDVFV